MVVAAAAPAVIGASQVGAGAAGAGGSALGANALLALLQGGMQGMASKGAGYNKKQSKEDRRRTLAALYSNLLQEQQSEYQNRRAQQNAMSANQGNALQELASGFRASLTGR
jgi:hypothetical protein